MLGIYPRSNPLPQNPLSFFAQPELLFCIPVIAGILFVLFVKSQNSADQKLRLLVANKLIHELVPLFSKKRKFFKFFVFLLALAFLVIALAQPQWGETQRSISPKSLDILIAVDLSKSMLARDVRPNRLERVKLTLTNLLPKVQGDRLGLIAFSGTAFVHCPLTLDHQAFAKSLDDLKVGLIPRPGTNLAKPIEEAAHTFSKDDTDKFLILISDGEDLEGLGLSKAKEVAKDGIKIFTIGIGSEEGSFISTDPVNQEAKSFLTDRSGKRILTRLDESALKNIASSTGGQYIPIGPTGEGIDHVFSELQTFGQKKLREQLSTTLPINRYQIFVFMGLVFLVSEVLTSTAKKQNLSSHLNLFLTLLFFFTGCWKTENIKQAEEANENGDPQAAANFYLQEIQTVADQDGSDLGKLYLNAGLSYLDAGDLDAAEKNLQNSLNKSTDFPELQSKALSALGNLYYLKTNAFLDQQDVNRARSTWEKAREFYRSSLSIKRNAMAEENLNHLNEQIRDRIESLVCKIQGIVWRDINGNGLQDSNEPLLEAKVFWDRDSNGEHNQSREPFVETNLNGQFAFEWISGTFPNSLEIGSVLKENNQTSKIPLLPLFPPPPPPLNANNLKNHFITMKEPGTYSIPIPWRAAPEIKGMVWNDQNANSIQDQNESGTSAVTLFLDENGNSKMDENETSFKPNKDGSFSHLSPPGQYTVCIQPDNAEANVTLPFESHNSYLTWIDFEKSPDPLLFGVFDPSSENNSSDSQSQQNAMDEQSEQEQNTEEGTEEQQQETNALYERLLQETESKSKPLQVEAERYDPTLTGRDY